MNKISYNLIISLILLSFQLTAQTQIKPFKGNDVKLSSSWISQKENLNTKYLHQLDPERLLHNFRVNAGLPSSAKPLEGWEDPGCGLRGHFVGHYLSACATLIAKEENTLWSRHIHYRFE